MPASAVKRLKEAYDSGDPEFKKIVDKFAILDIEVKDPLPNTCTKKPNITCRDCNTDFELMVNGTDFLAWQAC